MASAIRTFLGECYYDTTIGVPYFNQILGQSPPLAYVKAQICAAALTVPGCSNPVCYISSFTDRNMIGQVQFTDSNTGTVQAASFGGNTPDTLLFTNAGSIVFELARQPRIQELGDA